MNTKRTATASIMFAMLIVIGCATTAQLAPPIDVSMHAMIQSSGYTLEQLEYGRRLYITDCASCHSPEPVARYSRQQWDEIMPRMAKETKMSPADEQAVTAYVRFILQNPPSADSPR